MPITARRPHKDCTTLIMCCGVRSSCGVFRTPHTYKHAVLQ